MDEEEHTRGTRVNLLQIIAFLYLFVYIFNYVFNVVIIILFIHLLLF